MARRTPTTGPGVVGDIENLTSLTWGRGLDATSSATITAQLNPGCCDVISQIEPLRHEVEIWRNKHLVWCGPIIEFSVDESEESISLTARDLSYWFTQRAFRHTMKPKDIDLAYIFQGYAEYALGRGLPEWGVLFTGSAKKPADPPLYVDDFGLTLTVHPTGVTGDRTIYKGELRVVYTELEELGQTGVDWTVLNREMFIGGDEISDHQDSDNMPLGDPIQLPGFLTDDDFSTPARLRKTAEGMATEVLTRANGFRSRVGGPAADGIEITRVLDEYSIEDQASADAAAQSYFERGKQPLIYVEGQGALAPESPLSVQQLIPGSRVRASFSGGGCVNFTSPLRLDSVSVSWDADGAETIMPTLQPLGAAGADARGVGG